MKIGIIGVAGRMGRTLIREVMESESCQLAGGIARKNSEYTGKDLGALINEENIGITVTDDVNKLIEQSDVIIDFTSPSSTMKYAEIASNSEKAHIIGTTGLSEDDLSKLKKLANNTVIVQAPNMSVGVNLLLDLVEQTAEKLDDSYDIEIVEMHHKNKVDAPSGTALALGKAASDGRGVALADVAEYTREGQTGTRKKGNIGFATLRGGDVVGDHTVIFAAEGERLEITHKASDRKIFARGAIRAALWTKGKKPGFYSMKDVLGIK